MKIDAIENLEIVPTPKNYYQRPHVLKKGSKAACGYKMIDSIFDAQGSKFQLKDLIVQKRFFLISIIDQ